MFRGPSEDKVSATAPKGPKDVDDDGADYSPETKPTPEQLGQKVSWFNLGTCELKQKKGEQMYIYTHTS